MDILLIIVISLFLDLIIGEPPSFLHPVVYMGKLIDFLKCHLSKYNNRITGFVLTFLVLSLFIIPTFFILDLTQPYTVLYIIISSLILFTTFAIKELFKSIISVEKAIKLDINQARKSVSFLVSRKTENLSQAELISAAIETLTENVTDSVISPLFYIFILGILGGVAYRVINTLDAMVGYKNEEYIYIGWFPARLDDLANYVPARITGILIIISAAIMGLNWKNAYKTMIKDANKTPSPNSGYPMAAAAGALDIRLEKKDCYVLGEANNSLDVNMLDKALMLSKITILLFLVLSSSIFALLTYIIT